MHGETEEELNAAHAQRRAVQGTGGTIMLPTAGNNEGGELLRVIAQPTTPAATLKSPQLPALE